MRFGLCLSGGGVKGAAHIGALKAFEEAGLEFNYVSGTSSGSIVATLYAAGYKSDEIYEIFINNCKKIKYIEPKKIIKLIIGLIFTGKIIIDGLNSGKKLEKIIQENCNKKNIKNINQIKKILLIPSIDEKNGKIYYFSSAINNRKYSDEIVYINDIQIQKAIRASCSYPGVFCPCEILGTRLIDGGIRENSPWKELKKVGAEKVICITFSQTRYEKEKENIIDIVENSLKILNHELSNYELEGVDYNINIETENINLLEMNKLEYLYKKGYIIAKEFIKKELKNYNYPKTPGPDGQIKKEE